MYAVELKNQKLVETLLGNNPDLKLRNTKGKTAIDLAADTNYADIKNLFNGKQ